MKPYLFALLFLISTPFMAQDYLKSFTKIQEAEAKMALKKMRQRFSLNTGDYDVKYHRLELSVDPDVAFISGDVTTYFEAKEALSEITFELTDNMTVSQVTQRGVSLSFVHNSDDEVVITLPQVQNINVLDSLTISYSGNPESSGFGSFEQATHNGTPVIWTLSEPFGAKGWWPCKQDLIDKIDSIDVYLNTPQFTPNNEEYIAVSNGLEISQTLTGNSKTTRFKHNYPIPAYLIAIAATNYTVYSHEVANNGTPFDIVNYVYPEDLAYAQASTPITVDIMNVFATLFETYPYANEKYGHAQFGWGGGMEHTTVSFMGSFGQNLVAHELAHQWFGNKITCGSWKDIWLNEGFATYLTGLAVENLNGNANFTAFKQDRINSIVSQPGGAVYLADSDTTSVSRIFSSRLSYNKGSMVVHMLRKKLGDETFFQAMRNYLSHPDHAYGYAKTADFINIVETTSGDDLTAFFNDWVYNQGYPTYTLTWNQPSSNSVFFNLSQVQSHASVDFFEVPVPVRLIGVNGETQDVILNNTYNNQDFLKPVNFTVADVLFDPESDIISKNNEVTLSTEPYNSVSDITLHPNPTSHIIYLKKPENLQIQQVKIYNALGQLLETNVWTSHIDISRFATGILFVKFETANGLINKTVLKK
ncbi:Por secretion system C-terminal sorting domain-containing protein [Bizionia echini]|uniref:Aminopeptidase N n=1 Tax=Bizionia echini TaxID=649333 RepID=A0A1I4Z5I8_9FLAO|nr:M1 family aminopeptidase [Bizionia echini]SFN45283.1 Por secretion system C-terminal sorting domain-containing protein [Bizionia echini]